jgi:HD superfamily phosphodiesterase
MLTLQDVKNNEEVKLYITRADASLSVRGFTEHSFAHVTRVANDSGYILETLGFSEREIEIAKIAGYLHDIGNLVNRDNHAQTGALMAFRILEKIGFEPAEIATITTAIGNHDEGTGIPVSPVCAALILADKADVRRSRVRTTEASGFDIHDRVNYSVKNSKLEICDNHSVIKLKLEVDTKYGSVMEYFEIFLNRMIMCCKAAETLNLQFSLVVNDQQLV